MVNYLGFNVHDNADTSKARINNNHKIQFVNGCLTTSKVGTLNGGADANVTFDVVKGTFNTTLTNGSIVSTADGVATTADVATAVKNTGWYVNVFGNLNQSSQKTLELIHPTETVTIKAGEGIELNQSKGVITIISKVQSTPSSPTLSWNVGNTTGAKVGDVKAGNQVNFVNGNGTTATLSSGNGVTNVTFNVNSTALTPNTTMTDKVDTPTVLNSFVNASTVANAINQSGFKVIAGGEHVISDATLIHLNDTLTFNHVNTTNLYVNFTTQVVTSASNNEVTPMSALNITSNGVQTQILRGQY